MRDMRDMGASGAVTNRDFPKLSCFVRPGQYGITVGIPDGSLLMPIDEFVDKFVTPAMADLVQQIGGVELSPEFLQPALGVYASVSERYDGVSMRLVIVEDYPVDNTWLFPKRVRRYYDAGIDKFLTAPTTMAIRFDVHEPGVGVMERST